MKMQESGGKSVHIAGPLWDRHKLEFMCVLWPCATIFTAFVYASRVRLRVSARMCIG